MFFKVAILKNFVIFTGKNMVAIHFQKWYMMDLLNHYALLLSLETLQHQHNYTFHWCLPYMCTDTIKSWLLLSKVYEIGYYLVGSYYTHHLECRNYLLQRYDTIMVAINVIYYNYMLWKFHSHSSLCYQVLKGRNIK